MQDIKWLDSFVVAISLIVGFPILFSLIYIVLNTPALLYAAGIAVATTGLVHSIRIFWSYYWNR